MRQHPHLNQRDYFQEWNCISCYYLLCAACKNEELRAMSRPEFTNKDVWKVWKTCIYCELLYEPQVINLFGIWAKKHGDKFDLWKRQQTYVVLNNNFIVLTPNLKATNPSSGGENVLHAGFWYNRKKNKSLNHTPRVGAARRNVPEENFLLIIDSRFHRWQPDSVCTPKALNIWGELVWRSYSFLQKPSKIQFWDVFTSAEPEFIRGYENLHLMKWKFCHILTFFHRFKLPGQVKATASWQPHKLKTRLARMTHDVCMCVF